MIQRFTAQGFGGILHTTHGTAKNSGGFLMGVVIVKILFLLLWLNNSHLQAALLKGCSIIK